MASETPRGKEFKATATPPASNNSYLPVVVEGMSDPQKRMVERKLTPRNDDTNTEILHQVENTTKLILTEDYQLFKPETWTRNDDMSPNFYEKNNEPIQMKPPVYAWVSCQCPDGSKVIGQKNLLTGAVDNSRCFKQNDTPNLSNPQEHQGWIKQNIKYDKTAKLGNQNGISKFGKTDLKPCPIVSLPQAETLNEVNMTGHTVPVGSVVTSQPVSHVQNGVVDSSMSNPYTMFYGR